MLICSEVWPAQTRVSVPHSVLQDSTLLPITEANVGSRRAAAPLGTDNSVCAMPHRSLAYEIHLSRIVTVRTQEGGVSRDTLMRWKQNV